MHLRRFLFFLCSCFLLGPPFLAAQNVQKPFSLNAANQCAQISTAGQATVGIQVSGTWSATLQPQVSIGGGAATNTSVTPTGSTSSQNTITANGVYSASVAAVDAFFLCVSAYSSGTITGVLTISPAINANLFGGGGAGGAVNSVSGDGTIYNNSSSTGNVTLTLANTPTGTGGVVLKTSPTLVTPNLGTPSAGVITSLTGTCANCGANTVDSAVSSTNASYSILTGSATSGQQEPNTIASFTINPSTGAMNVPGALTVSSCSGCGGGAYTFDAPIVNTSGTVSLQNSTPANITALTGTDTLIPTNSGAFTSGHSVIADANGGIADSGSANVTAASTTTFTNKSIAGSEVNSGLVASTVGGTGVNNSVTLTLGTTARNYATLGTGFEYNTTTTGAATDATAAQLGALINIAQYDVLVSGGTAAAVAGVAPGSTSGLPFVSQGASSNPTFAALALTALATQTNATFLSNVSGSTAAPSANALPTTANALIKTSNSNGALAASTVSDGGSGVTVGSPTGGAEGAGTLNATGLYINGSAVGTGGPGTGTQYDPAGWATTSTLGSIAPTSGYDASSASADRHNHERSVHGCCLPLCRREWCRTRKQGRPTPTC